MPTVIDVRERPTRTGNLKVSSNFEGGFNRIFIVVFDNSGWTDADAYGANDGTKRVPLFNDVIGGKVLMEKSFRQIDLVTAEVTCTYSVPQPGEEIKPDDPEVERWAIQVEFNNVPFEVETQTDVNGSQILNAANDFIVGVMLPKNNYDLVVTFNCVAIDWEGIDQCMNAMNDRAFDLVINGQHRTFPVRTMRFVGLGISYVKDPSGITYPRVSYRLTYRPETWIKQIANAGLNYLDGSGNKLPILDSYHQRISTPAYLKVDGSGVLPAGDPVNWIEVQAYPEADLLGVLLWDLST